MKIGRAAINWSQLGLQLGLLVLGLGLLQVVAERTNRRFDLTPARTFSLAPVTRNVLAEVTDTLRITIFFRRGTREQYTDLARRLQAANGRIEVTLYDLDRFPERARTLDVDQYGRAAIEYAGRRAVVAALPEEELAGGILRVLRGRSRRVVFTTGHGERAP
ncbi:MAG TPA: Gldg family protein, partial [Candidatus Binatia bacterium]|nr:Gldg family protein [Candidatus Binatia bacterium]